MEIPNVAQPYARFSYFFDLASATPRTLFLPQGLTVADQIAGKMFVGKHATKMSIEEELIKASAHGALDTISSILSSFPDVNVNYVDARYGMTAVICAAANGHAPIVARLIEHGANLDLRDHADDGGFTALIEASRFGHVGIGICIVSSLLLSSFLLFSPLLFSPLLTPYKLPHITTFITCYCRMREGASHKRCM